MTASFGFGWKWKFVFTAFKQFGLSLQPIRNKRGMTMKLCSLKKIISTDSTGSRGIKHDRQKEKRLKSNYATSNSRTGGTRAYYAEAQRGSDGQLNTDTALCA
jgi:hypothetical protein